MVSPILSALVDAMRKRGGIGGLKVDLYRCDVHRDVQVAFAFCECGNRVCAFCGQWKRARRGRQRDDLRRRLRAAGGRLLHITLDSAAVPETSAAVRSRAKSLLVAFGALLRRPFGQAHFRGARAEVDFSAANETAGFHLHLHVLAIGDFDRDQHLDELRAEWETVLSRAAGANALNRGGSPVDARALATVQDAMRVHEYAVKGFLFDPEEPAHRYFGTLASDVFLSTTTAEYVPGHPSNEVVVGRGAGQWRAFVAGVKGAHLSRSYGVLRGEPSEVIDLSCEEEPPVRLGLGALACGDEDGCELAHAIGDVSPSEEQSDDDSEPEPLGVQVEHQVPAVTAEVSLRDCLRCREPLRWEARTSGRNFLLRPDAAAFRIVSVYRVRPGSASPAPES